MQKNLTSPLPKLRLYVEHPLSADASIEVAGDQAHYLLNVMRSRQGDKVRLFNGTDGEWVAQLDEIAKKSCQLKLRKKYKEQTQVPDLSLLFAPVKRARLDYLVQKATELGVAKIQPVLTTRTIVSRVNQDRIRANVIEAAEQTGRMCVPEVLPATSLFEVLQSWPTTCKLMFCDEAGDDPAAEWGGDEGKASEIGTVLQQYQRDEPWAVLIGPEGGFDSQERAQLRSLSQVVPVSLGPRILRADTAAVAALSLWQSVLGDWT